MDKDRGFFNQCTTSSRIGDGSLAVSALRVDAPSAVPNPCERTASRSAKLGRYWRRPEAATKRRRADGDHVGPLIGRASALLRSVTTAGPAHRVS